jgi:CRP/FNR family transcriptional regulator
VEAKEFEFVEGDPTTHVFRVETGAVALDKILVDGRRQIVGFAYPGDLIGLGERPGDQADAACVLYRWLHRSAAQDPALGVKHYEALARELAATRDLGDFLGLTIETSVAPSASAE